MTVFDRFARVFPGVDLETELRDALVSMPLKSNCGNDCAAAINRAAAFAESIRMAWGDGYPGRITPDDIAETAAEICATFICG